MRLNSRGFTLIEILMAILLMGIMSAVGYSQFVDFSSEAKRTVTLDRMNALRRAIIGDPTIVSNGQYANPGYFAQMGTLPSSLNDLAVQGAQTAYDPFQKRGWRGPYVSTTEPNWNRDGWGTALVYSAATRSIRSCGNDRTCNNADDITVTF